MQDAIILYENGKAIGGEGHPTDADDITFNNTGTDLVSEEVESAIKEVNGKVSPLLDFSSAEVKIGEYNQYSVYRRRISQNCSLPYQAWGTVVDAATMASWGISYDKVLEINLSLTYVGQFIAMGANTTFAINATEGLKCSQLYAQGTPTMLVKGFITYYK